MNSFKKEKRKKKKRKKEKKKKEKTKKKEFFWKGRQQRQISVLIKIKSDVPYIKP